MAPRLNLRMGLSRVTKPMNPSEAGFVSAVNAQLKALETELLDIFQQVEDASPEIMITALEPTFQKSQERCPVATGELKSSGYLENASFKGKPRVEMGYARGGSPRYAVYVHENLDVHHAPPTEAKFLERPMMEDLGDIYARLVEGYVDFMFFGSQ